jgi:nuclear pore complex protein Nup93
LADSFIVTYTEFAGQDVALLNFPRIIKTYISSFVHQEPQSALQYAYLIALASDAPDGLGEKEKNMCLEMVRDVVLASRSWAKLLGSVRADGTKEVSLMIP